MPATRAARAQDEETNGREVRAKGLFLLSQRDSAQWPPRRGRGRPRGAGGAGAGVSHCVG